MGGKVGANNSKLGVQAISRRTGKRWRVRAEARLRASQEMPSPCVCVEVVVVVVVVEEAGMGDSSARRVAVNGWLGGGA